MLAFVLRPAIETDREFVFDTYREAVGPYVDRTWGWNEQFQHRGFWENLALEHFRVIIVDGTRCGAAHWTRRVDCYYLDMIFLLPQFRNRGIGSKIVADLLSQARAEGLAVTLRVMRVNPAKSLYERLQFTVTREDAAFYEMRAA